MQTIEKIQKEQMRLDHPDFASGDTVTVYVRIPVNEKGQPTQHLQ